MGCNFQVKQFLRFSNELETTRFQFYQRSANNILDQLVAFLYISIAISRNPAMAWLLIRVYTTVLGHKITNI